MLFFLFFFLSEIHTILLLSVLMRLRRRKTRGSTTRKGCFIVRMSRRITHLLAGRHGTL